MNATKLPRGEAGPAQLLRLAKLLTACGVGVDLPAALWTGAWHDRVEEDVRRTPPRALPSVFGEVPKPLW